LASRFSSFDQVTSAKKDKKGKGINPISYVDTLLISYYGNKHLIFVNNIVFGTFDECTT